MGAPVVKTIDDCLDPERAYELLPGKTRSSTLKRYVTMCKRGGYGYRRLSVSILPAGQQTWSTT